MYIVKEIVLCQRKPCRFCEGRDLEKEMTTHSSILAWKISWTEEPGGLQSMGSQRVGHDWATNTQHTFTMTYIQIPIVSDIWGYSKIVVENFRVFSWSTTKKIFFGEGKWFNIIFWVFCNRREIGFKKINIWSLHYLVFTKCLICYYVLHGIVPTRVLFCFYDFDFILGSILKHQWPNLSFYCDLGPLSIQNWCKGRMFWITPSNYISLKLDWSLCLTAWSKIAKFLNGRNMAM